MAAAYDADSDSGALASDPSWTHTPVGTPKGVYVAVMQFGSEETVSCTYGGVAMTPLTIVDGDALTEPHMVYPFFLGSSIPTGAQTVTVTASGATNNKRAIAVTVTASTDTEVDDEGQVVNGSLDDPSVNLTASADAVGVSAMCSGLGTATNVTAGSGFTKDLGGGLSASSANSEHGTSTFSAGTVTFAFTTTAADEVVMHAVLITEAASGVTLTPASLTRTRAQGTPVVSPQVVMAGLTHTRAIVAPTVTTGVALGPASIVHSRAQGTPTLSPQVLPAGLARSRAQGAITVSDGSAPPAGDLFERTKTGIGT